MFDKATYKARRQYLKKELGAGFIMLAGNKQSSSNFADNWYPFRQDSTFLYYCGLDKPHLTLIIDIDNDREILFGDDPTLDEIVWTGPVASLQELAEKSGIEENRPYKKITAFLQKISSRSIHFLPPYRPEQVQELKKWLDLTLGEIFHQRSQKLIQAVIKQRSIKTPAEITQIEEAVTFTAEMHLEAIQSTRIGMKEQDVMSRVHQKALEKGGHLAFPIILTTKGHILHNHAYGHTIKNDDMILCDAGAENAMHYAGDLTRTFPAGKQFTSIQRALYEVVLESQLAAVETMKPGVFFKDIHLIACRKLVEGLKDFGLMKGNPSEAVAVGAHTLFFQCGLGHMMGLDVHDMENLGEEYVGYTPDLKKSTIFGLKSLRLGRALEPGFVVTIEPGIYIIPELIEMRKAEGQYKDFVCYDKLEEFKGFGGIRIEDDYVITKSGSRLLGKALPKKTEEIETMREKTLS